MYTIRLLRCQDIQTTEVNNITFLAAPSYRSLITELCEKLFFLIQTGIPKQHKQKKVKSKIP